MQVYRKHLRGIALAFLCLFVLALGITPAAAQNAPQPITVGEEVAGEVSPANIAPAYVYTATNAEAIGVQVSSTTPGFAPALRVLNSAGALVENVANESGAAEINTVAQLPQAGQYIFQVTTANGFGGQFTIMLGEALAPPEPLNPGQSANGTVDLATPLRRYVFNAADQALVLVIEAAETSDAIATVTGEDGVDLAVVTLRFQSVRFNIAPNSGQYTVTMLHSGGANPENFRLALNARAAEGAAPTEAAPTAAPQPTRVPLEPLPSTGPCVVASIDGGRVNVRSSPSTTEDNVVAQLSGNRTVPVIGRLADNSWFQLSLDTGQAWVAGFVVRQGGDCSAVPVVSAPGQPAPTQPPTSGGGGQPGVVDLFISGVTITPTSPFEDHDFSVNVTVGNQGANPANNVLVRVSLDADGFNINNPTSELSIPTIPGNSAVTVNVIGLRADDDGEVDVEIIVDPNNAIGESNDSNNSNQFSFDVLPSRPDLVVSALDVDTDNGSSVVEIRVQVCNRGVEESEDFQVTLDFDPANAVQQVLYFDDLNPDECDEQFVDVDLGADDDYTVTATVDSTNTTQEAREDNNTRRANFDIDL